MSDLDHVSRLIRIACELCLHGGEGRPLGAGDTYVERFEGPSGEYLGRVVLYGGSETEAPHAVYGGPEGAWSMLLGKRGRPVGYPMPVYVGAKGN